MAAPPKPDVALAQRVLPASLFRVLSHIFEQGIQGCVLAGGTSLTGFYAGHRRSDDLDLFTQDPGSQKATVLAVKSLDSIGVKLDIRNDTAQYFAATGKVDSHLFQVTVVQDSNLFRVGAVVLLPGNIRVASLETLFKMKAATLVSRCSEKDLYDLIWIFGKYPSRTYADLIKLGNEIDRGVNGEDILSSVSGAILKKSACNFALNDSRKADEIYSGILHFREQLIEGLQKYLEQEPAPPLGALVRKLKRLRG